MPESFREAWKLAFRYGLDCRPVWNRPDITAELVEVAPDDWTIFYNARQSERQRLRYVIHEIAEYVGQRDHPSDIFDEIPGGRIFHYHGGDNPRDVRHRVALYVETRYVRMLNKHLQSLCEN